MTDYPIIPPPELVEQWMQDHSTKYDLARHAAQWGADQELKACVQLANEKLHDGHSLRAARRPKPPSLKEQALEIVRGTPVNSAGLYSYEHVEIIRRALESLPD